MNQTCGSIIYGNSNFKGGALSLIILVADVFDNELLIKRLNRAKSIFVEC